MVVSKTISDISKLDLKKAVVVSPSDTVIGFHALYSSREAVAKIENLKQRKENFIVLVSNMDEAQSLCEFSKKQLSIARTYWPGSVTFILNSITGSGTLALRLPKNAYVHQMLQAFGGPIVSTSCNLHGEPVAKSLEAAQGQFGGAVDLYLSFPQNENTLASTIVDLTKSPFKIVRQGGTPISEASLC